MPDKITSLDQLPARLQKGFEAAKLASSYSDGESKREQMGAAVFAGSRLLSIGFNQYYKSRPDNKFIKIVNDRVIEYYKATHAEQSALDKIKYKYNENYTKSKLILYIYREGADCMPSASAPCELCQSVIKRSGISIVRFFTASGAYKEWKVDK
jgi:deoxycytidylate deaminase